MSQPHALRPRQSVPIYFYVYDGSLSEPKFANTLARIETHLTDLELQGRVGRLGPLKSAAEMIKNALRAGATTVVAVGNDRTVAETINAMAESTATFGIIPIGKPNDIAALLGIPDGEAACEVLAARKTEVVDLGRANQYYFLSTVEVQAPMATIECDGRCTLEAESPTSRVAVTNLAPGGHCQDGFLEATIESAPAGGWFKKEVKRSVVPFHQARISTAAKDEGSLLIENSFSLKLPATIEVIPQALKVIVGKDRVF